MTLVIILLMTKNGITRALGYFLGYYLSYTIMGIIIVVIGAQVAESTLEFIQVVISVAFIILGMLLIFVGLRNYRAPQRGDNNREENRFIKMMTTVTARKAFGLGVIVTLINFKNLSLFLAAISVVALSDMAVSMKVGMAMLVAIIFCFSVSFPIIVFLVFPTQREAILQRIRHFLNVRSRQISIYLPLAFGIILMGVGLVNLT